MTKTQNNESPLPLEDLHKTVWPNALWCASLGGISCSARTPMEAVTDLLETPQLHLPHTPAVVALKACAKLRTHAQLPWKTGEELIEFLLDKIGFPDEVQEIKAQENRQLESIGVQLLLVLSETLATTEIYTACFTVDIKEPGTPYTATLISNEVRTISIPK